MKLALFDIDGTLTRTNGVDARAFNAAFAEVLDISDLDGTWASFEHRTDSGIADEICRRHLGRPGSREELQAVKSRFVELLRAEAARDPGQFAPVPGARAFLEHLIEAGWVVALATGGWQASARLKLDLAGLDSFTPALPMAHADDALRRHDIVRLALRRAAEGRGLGSFERVVSLGDGTWDLEVARDLGLAFVGVTAESDEAELRAAGAAHTLVDYADPDLAQAVLHRATVPPVSLEGGR